MAPSRRGRRGTAVYRSGNPNDATQQALAQKYDAAEATARKQGLGLWQPPAPPADRGAALDARRKARILGYAGFALLILAIFTVSITRLSIARRDRAERARLRNEQQTTLSFAMAAEVEIVLATARRLVEQISGVPGDRPVPGAISATLALPSTTFWNANAERLHLLPAEVTVPLLRFHAIHEDAARKLAVAPALPSAALASTLNELAEIGGAAVTAIEAFLGISRSEAPEPAAASTGPAPSPAPSSGLKSPPPPATH